MKTPTPIELMAFYDGELDEPRAREVRAWLAANGEGAALVDNFRALGRHVRKAAPSPAPPIDLGDRIFAALDAEPSGPRVKSQPAPSPRLAPVLTLRPAAPEPAAEPRRLPAARRALGWAPLGATGMAFAAAAAFILWWSPVGLGPRATSNVGPSKPTTLGITAHGTDVNTVDFGERMGSLYFVSNDSQSTPVLWLDDDDESDEAQ
jgi:negative regulator of sigma E activity